MDFAKAFTYIFDDKDWIKKIGIAAGILLISPITLGILALPVIGWGMEILRRTTNGRADILPEWDNFGGFFMDGLKGLGVALIYALPIIVIQACNAGITIALTSAGSSASGDTADAMVMASTGISGLLLCLVVIFAVAIALLQPAGMALLANTGKFANAANPMNALAEFRRNPGGYLLAGLVGSLIVSLLGSVGVVACFVGAFVGYAIGIAVQNHLLGQAYSKAHQS
ncbi:MAG TPA: DUF4013 domain-containing protein [Anaerolineales bacterium]|nr:DUF4013 domain-containing protein [Anaerolineales bacterium]